MDLWVRVMDLILLYNIESSSSVVCIPPSLLLLIGYDCECECESVDDKHWPAKNIYITDFTTQSNIPENDSRGGKRFDCTCMRDLLSMREEFLFLKH